MKDLTQRRGGAEELYERPHAEAQRRGGRKVCCSEDCRFSFKISL
jgi:hypothetical protein